MQLKVNETTRDVDLKSDRRFCGSFAKSWG